MRASEIRKVETLLMERNINNPQSSLHCSRKNGFGSLCIMFMESLTKRDIDYKVIIRLCTDLRPFMEYIENTYRIIAIDNLEQVCVEAYAAAIRRHYEAQEKTFTNAANANDLLSAVRIFCLYLYTAGLLPVDYGLTVPVIPFPAAGK